MINFAGFLKLKKMTKTELKEWIIELACRLDRGDLKIDELMNEVEEVIDKYTESYHKMNLKLLGVENNDSITINTELINALQTYLNACSKEQRREASVIAKRALSKALN